MESACLDNVVRDDTDVNKAIVSINAVEIRPLPVRLLRRFCAKLKVSGYKILIEIAPSDSLLSGF